MLVRKMKELVEERDPTFKASMGWLRGFPRRFNLCFRRKTNSKGKSLALRAPVVIKFWNELRKVRMRRASAAERRKVVQQYNFYTTLNVDQVPLPFASDKQITIEERGAERVWIRQPGSGLTVHFAITD